MKNILKLGLVLCGFTLATIATTTEVKAKETITNVAAGGCVGNGACGMTSQGTSLIGKWRE